ncbi:hypothetical protein Tco_0103824 [Tanacetum coccineum]
MSTSKTYQQSLADVDSETRPPMVERGSYIPWASRFTRYINRKRENRKWLNKALDEGPYQFQMFVPTGLSLPTLQTVEDLQGEELLHYDAEIKLMNLILLSIPNKIYNSADACTMANEMWKRVEREALVSVYNRFAQLMNDLEQIKMIFPIVTQFEKLVNASRAKKLEKSHDPLALVAHMESFFEKYIILLCKTHLELVQARVGDSKYFMEQMLLAKQDEAGVILTDEQNDFLFADASRMEEIEELSANICLMARIQPVDNTSDVGPSYDSAFIRMFMLGPKPLSVYDSQLKYGLGYPNPYTLKQAISQCPKIYLASSLSKSEIPLNVRDTKDTLDDASKSQQKMNDPIAIANK